MLAWGRHFRTWALGLLLVPGLLPDSLEGRRSNNGASHGWGRHVTAQPTRSIAFGQNLYHSALCQRHIRGISPSGAQFARGQPVFSPSHYEARLGDVCEASAFGGCGRDYRGAARRCGLSASSDHQHQRGWCPVFDSSAELSARAQLFFSAVLALARAQQSSRQICGWCLAGFYATTLWLRSCQHEL